MVTLYMKKLVIHLSLKNAYLSVIGAMRGTSKGKLYNELCPESLHLRRWYRKLGYFYKFFSVFF